MPCSPRMRACKVNNPHCAHLCFVRDYHAERERQEVHKENNYRETDGQNIRLITFKDWLKATKSVRAVESTDLARQ